jgi:hypothetical protein
LPSARIPQRRRSFTKPAGLGPSLIDNLEDVTGALSPEKGDGFR